MDGKVMSTEELVELIRVYGVRYVIRNYKLTDKVIDRIINNELCDIEDEKLIDYNDIMFFQKKFKNN